MLASYIRFFLDNKLVAYLLLFIFVGWGLVTAPFDFGFDGLPRDPVAVDAIPDIGENQQIVFTNWMGRSPQDVEDQISYPLTTALLGIPGVRSIRSNSMFGFSTIYIIFNDEVEFYWSRSRILEKLNSLPANTLPEGVQPTLGPDATALGQIYWYTLEGRDANGNPTGGWDLHELRSIQDFYVRYGLSAAEGVAEVASIGGFVKEYQVDVDPEAMKANNVTLQQVMAAIKGSNIDIGAQTLEINLAEYFVRGLGYVKSIEDIEKGVIRSENNVPISIGDVARVSIGPAARRGVLDKSGAEAVGGVVVARYGANPLEVINNVKEKIAELAPGLATKTLADGTVSQVTIVPFYDRTQLINETIGTLQEALSLEILITIIVVLLLLFNLKSSLLVSASLPVAVLMCFIAMRYFGVDANIVALSGIAIAIGTMVDMGIVLTESMINRIREAPPDESLRTSIYEATMEVASAVITAVATTVISFLPVFTMEASEGKLFRPLAYTKSFALIASIVVAVTILPPLAHSLFSLQTRGKTSAWIANALVLVAGLAVAFMTSPFLGFVLALIGLAGIIKIWLDGQANPRYFVYFNWGVNIIYALVVAYLLAGIWMPLGVGKSTLTNFFFVILLAGGLIGLFQVIIHFYENILRFLLQYKLLFLLVVGFIVYLGYSAFRETGQEFMPSLDEGSFLLMPTAMPHAGMQENIKNLRLLDMSVTAIPEVEMVVGKAGRVSSALDPAPMSMYENVIQYKSEFKVNEQGHRVRYRYENGEYLTDEAGQLIPDEKGRYFRQWRDHIHSPDDIWNEIVQATQLPGVTSAPKLQPIETRLVMLQTGMRAPMGIKVQGPDLATIEAFGLELENHLKAVEGVKEAAVFADRIVGKPYLLLDIKRDAIARYGLSVQTVQQHIQAAIGGMPMTTTVEGRERYVIRIRYPRELRDDPEALQRIYVPTAQGQQIPLGQLVDIRYEAGAQSIKSEDGFLLGYVLFDREGSYAEGEVVDNAREHFDKLIADGTLSVPAGVSYRFAGNYEQQIRANKRLSIVVPVALAIIFLLLYFQFGSVVISLMVFTGVFIAFAGGFLMLGLYDTDWFLNFDLFGTNMRDLFQIRTINLSVAVWVGFLALFGIATDDGVLVATFLQSSFREQQPDDIPAIRDAVVTGGLRRVRPAMMTTATTILALLPVLTSTGRGADIMLPMAIPSFGGMALQMITMFTVPVLFALWQESRWRWKNRQAGNAFYRNVGLLLLIGLGGFAATAEAQSLDVLQEQIQQNNPALKALDYEYRAASERVSQVGQLPDPEIGVGVFALPVETRLGPQRLRGSATQAFPWFGTLAQKEELEQARAQVLYERTDVQLLELNYQLKQAYYQLYGIRRSNEIVEEKLVILHSLERLALTKVESGKASAADVLRVQMKIKELEQELALLKVSETAPLAAINQLRYEPLGTTVEITEELEFALMLWAKDSLASQISIQHPMIRMYARQQEVSRQAIALNELNAKPTFGLGVDYFWIDPRENATINDNGRNALQLRASIKVPLYRQQYQAKEREEHFRMQAIDEQRNDLLQRYLLTIEQAYTRHEMARLQTELYQQQIELTEAAIRILRSAYSTQATNFDELLRLENDLVDYKLKLLKATVESHLAKSEVERFLGG